MNGRKKRKAEWRQWHDGWFTYHYCTNCGYKHFEPGEKVLPTNCPNCHKQLDFTLKIHEYAAEPMKGEDNDE